MKYQFFKFISLLFAFTCIASASECYNNNAYISKEVINVGDVFYGGSLSIYGLLCENNKYSIITYLDGGKYGIKKYTKKSFGINMPNSEGNNIQYYYKYFNVRGNIDIINSYLPYKNNDILNKKLQELKLMNLEYGNVKVMRNGVFKEKIYFSKAAKAGWYINEVYVLNNSGDIISWHGDRFLVAMNGNGAKIKEMMTSYRFWYVIVTVLSIISMICLIIFSVELFKVSKNV